MISDEQYTALESSVRGYLNGITDIALRQACEHVAGEYISDIGGIPYNMGPYSPNEYPIMIDAPYGGRITAVERVWKGGEYLPGDYWHVARDEDGCTLLYLHGYERLIVEGPADVDVRVRWFPTSNTEELPYFFFNENEKALKDGVLAFLLAQVGRPWADQATALQFIQAYDKDKYDARYTRLTENDPGHRGTFVDPNERWI